MINEALLWVIALTLVGVIAAPGWMAIYIVRKRDRETPPEAYGLMQKAMGELTRQSLQTNKEMLRMQHRIGELTMGVQVLSSQIRRLKHEPEWKDAAAEARPEDHDYDTAALHRRMARQFNMDELNDLAFQMKIQTGELGENTVSARARAIINYADRRGELAQLVALCRQLRPKGGF
jgi:hypothetical protein